MVSSHCAWILHSGICLPSTNSPRPEDNGMSVVSEVVLVIGWVVPGHSPRSADSPPTVHMEMEMLPMHPVDADSR